MKRRTLCIVALVATAAMCVMVAPVVLGQAKAAERLANAMLKAAPAPLRTVAHAMIAEEQTPSTGLIAEMQAPSGAGATLPQGQAEDKPFKFDVVSIRPVKPVNQSGSAAGRLRLTGDGLQISNLPLSAMLSDVYVQQLQFASGRILGLPDWANTEAFDVQAKVADSDIAEWSKLSQDRRGPAQERWRQSLLLLLTEQFKLKMHSETRTEPIYALVVAKGGPKLKSSTSDKPPTMKMTSTSHLSYIGAPMDRVAVMFAQITGREVVDKTGLTGKYDFTLDWTGHQDTPATTAGSDTDSYAPMAVFDVMQDQLGLKLESQKGPVEYIVVDHAEKPEPN